MFIHREDSNMFKRLKNKALSLGASYFGISKAKDKKYYVVYNGYRINFGNKNFSDFTFHGDNKRRMRYRNRHSKIKLKNGSLAYKDKRQPSYWAFNLIW